MITAAPDNSSFTNMYGDDTKITHRVHEITVVRPKELEKYVTSLVAVLRSYTKFIPGTT